MGIDTHSRETTLANLFLLPSEKGYSLKGYNLSFPFRKVLAYRKANRKSQKLSPLSEMVGNLQIYPFTLKCYSLNYHTCYFYFLGTLGIVDYDEVELSNLHRQVLHRESRVGVCKSVSAATSCQE